MKTSCISHPKNEFLIIIRKWQVEFCEGDHCAAALLSFFEYWHNIKLEIRSKNIKSNDVAEMHGDNRIQDETLIQFHNQEDLENGILSLFKRSSITKALEFLEKKGVISTFRNPNPKYAFDKTKYFIFYPEVCERWLENRGNDSPPDDGQLKSGSGSAEISSSITENNLRSADFSTSTAKNSRRSVDFKSPSLKSSRAITETTTEITFRDKNTAALANSDSLNVGNAKLDFFIKFNEPIEPLIEKQLTTNQSKLISLLADAAANFLSKSPIELFNEICFCVLDSTCFSNAGKDFQKKINTIKKQIRENKWITPVGLVENREKLVSLEKQEIKSAIENLVGQHRWYEDALDRESQSDNAEHFKQMKSELAEKIECLVKKLKEIDEHSKINKKENSHARYAYSTFH